MLGGTRCRAHRRDRAVSIVAAVVLVIGGMAAMLVGPAAHAGGDRTDPGPVYPAGAAVTAFQGQGFDTCTAPPRSAMEAWRASPYRALGIYISGVNRACKQPELTSDWVTKVSSSGWRLLPVNGGLQAPCRDNTRKKAIDPQHARAQGVDEAAHSVAAAAGLGILPGSAIYADIENYHARDDETCVPAIAEYLSGWTNELHRRGYLSGMYGNLSSAVADAAARYASTDWSRPDAVWQARWDGSDRLHDWAGIDESRWPWHQRAKQYRGDHVEKHGGVSMNIDSDHLDAPVATVAALFPVTGRAPVVHRAPTTSSPRVGVLPVSGNARVVCQTPGAGGRRWDQLAGGNWVSDAELANGVAKQVPECTYPGSVTAPAGAVTRAGPGLNHQAGFPLPLGTLAWVGCREFGPGRWLRLPDHSWVATADLSFGDRNANALPPCPAELRPAGTDKANKG
jgi:hypothetical protein